VVIAFYLAGAVALCATLMAITRRSPVHALLYLIVSLLAVAVVFALLGAPFVAALEVVVYAGAIVVLFVFLVMLLNLGPRAAEQERRWLGWRVWIGPALLALVLAAELVFLLLGTPGGASGPVIGPRRVGTLLYGPFLIGVELASFLLLAGLVAAYHLGRPSRGSSEPEGRRP